MTNPARYCRSVGHDGAAGGSLRTAARSFDHLVGAGEHRGRQVEAETLRRHLVWFEHWKVSRETGGLHRSVAAVRFYCSPRTLKTLTGR
jgi:hypothetical protein